MLKLNADQAQKIIDRYSEMVQQQRRFNIGESKISHHNSCLQSFADASEKLSEHLDFAKEIGIEKSEVVIMLDDVFVTKLQGWLC